MLLFLDTRFQSAEEHLGVRERSGDEMSDLESKLAEARGNHVYSNPTHANIHEMAVDRIGAIAREVVAEKDAEIARWRTWATEMPDYGWDLDNRDSPLWRWFDDMPKDEQND
jgi:hypothetical protein